MSEAIADTGPVLHLREIERLDALGIFDRVELVEGVYGELVRLGVLKAGRPVGPVMAPLVLRSEPAAALPFPLGDDRTLQAADRQVLALAQLRQFRVPVLTDDLALRRRVEQGGGLVVGTVGLLVRSFRLGRTSYQVLQESVDRLMNASTLHLSRPFRAYLLDLLRGLDRN